MNSRFNKGSISLRYIWPLVAFIAIAIFLGIGLTLDPKHIPSSKIGKPAPSFSLPLLSNPDKRFSPQELLGQRWLLNVWASWCVGCRIEHPILNELADKTNITMVGLNWKDSVQNAQNWLHERGDPYLLSTSDLAGDVAIDYGVYGAPETFIIDEQGMIIFKHIGPLTAEVVNANILPLLSPNQAKEAEGDE